MGYGKWKLNGFSSYEYDDLAHELIRHTKSGETVIHNNDGVYIMSGDDGNIYRLQEQHVKRLRNLQYKARKDVIFCSWLVEYYKSLEDAAKRFNTSAEAIRNVIEENKYKPFFVRGFACCIEDAVLTDDDLIHPVPYFEEYSENIKSRI